MAAINMLVPAEIYRLYHQMGSLRKLQSELEARGVINPMTNKAFCAQSILNAMRRSPQYKAELNRRRDAEARGGRIQAEMAGDQREKLAEYAHQTWSEWTKRFFEKAVLSVDGTATLDADSVKKWTRQMNTSYEDLSRAEKESYSVEADKILAILD